ncbi:hypothetical protein C8R47DRAFT_368315 [Mycena vitilis]|nr:hypothetical protein C8R47DRAFT_368315 [Mycena vitilis]
MLAFFIFILLLTNFSNAASFHSLPGEWTAPSAQAYNFTSSFFFRSVNATPSVSPFIKSVTIGASITIGAAALVLAVVFAVLWRRLNRKRPHKLPRPYMLEAGRPSRPTLRIGTDFPAEVKPAYLDSPRPLHASIVARDEILSPLAACQQPGFVPRPIPFNVPVSIPVSRAPSMRSAMRSASRSSRHTQHTLGAPAEDLAELLEDLSRHYVLKDSSSPRPMPGHRHSSSWTGRSRVYKPYHDGV